MKKLVFWVLVFFVGLAILAVPVTAQSSAVEQLHAYQKMMREEQAASMDSANPASMDSAASTNLKADPSVSGRFEDYPQDAESGIPSFVNTRVAIAWHGTTATDARSRFWSKGVRSFWVPNPGAEDPCDAGVPVICATMDVVDEGPVSGSGGSYFGGNRGGGTYASSFTGEQYTVQVRLALVSRGPSGLMIRIPLAVASQTAIDGFGQSSSSGYGGSGYGGFSSGGTTPTGIAIGNAVGSDIAGLLGGKIRRFLATSTVHWLPGAKGAVESAFSKKARN